MKKDVLFSSVPKYEGRKNIVEAGNEFVVSFDNLPETVHIVELSPISFRLETRPKEVFDGLELPEGVVLPNEVKGVLLKTLFYVAFRYYLFVEVASDVAVSYIYDTVNNPAIVTAIERWQNEEMYSVDLDAHIYFVNQEVNLIDFIDMWLSGATGKPIFIHDILSVIKTEGVVPLPNEHEVHLGGLWLKWKNPDGTMVEGWQLSGVEYNAAGHCVPLVSILDQAMIALPGFAEVGKIDPTKVKLWSERDNSK